MKSSKRKKYWQIRPATMYFPKKLQLNFTLLFIPKIKTDYVMLHLDGATR